MDSCSSKIIYIVTKEGSFKKLKALLKIMGLSVSVSGEEIKEGYECLNFGTYV